MLLESGVRIPTDLKSRVNESLDFSTFTDGGATEFSLRILQAGGLIVGVSETA
jgi:hypothetical protein